MAKGNKGGKQYSESEKKAFAAGRAFETAKRGERVKCRSEAEKASFRAGVKSVRGKRK